MKIKFKQISPINLGLILNSFTALSIQKRTKKSFQTSKVNSFKNDNILATDSVMMRSAELDVELTKRVDQVIKVKIGGCVLARESCHHRAANFFFLRPSESLLRLPTKKKEKFINCWNNFDVAALRPLNRLKIETASKIKKGGGAEFFSFNFIDLQRRQWPARDAQIGFGGHFKRRWSRAINCR